jgi:S-DNA-T family DNA segregation ATPase FtsK/SpoIIIE
LEQILVKKQISQAKSKSGSGKSRASAYTKGKSGTSRSSRSSQVRRSASRQPKNSLSWKRISNERKLDILGVVLSLLGFLTILSLLSSQRGKVTGWWIDSLSKVSGWGAFVLPLALLVIGIWLILRNIEKLPLFSTERVVGIFLLYLNVLAWLHILGGGGWEIAAAGKGGGYIGAFFEQNLINGLGKAGAIIVLVGWSLIALGLSLDISIPDLFRKIQPVILRFRENRQLKLAAKQAAHRVQPYHPAPIHDGGNESVIVEQGFTPMLRGVFPHSASATKPPKESSGQETMHSNIPAKKPVPTSSHSGAPPTVTQGLSAEKWRLPDIKAILDPITALGVESTMDKQRGGIIEDTLASFGAPVKIVEIKRGPTITQFGVEPLFLESRTGRTRVRVSKIANLADDLALALAAPRIRIQAPVPGHNYVGIEVPNSEATRVTLLEVLESKNFVRKKSALRVALGMNVSGEPIASDLSGLPHLLIAGTTGSGKSVCVNSLLCCLLLNNTPAELRMIMVDPKRVELTGYNGIPHLLAPVITDSEKVVSALQWIQREMDARYHRFSQVSCRNIQDYNGQQADKLPYIIVVIDELADLMMLAPDETERSLTRLAQLARATGIHLILATQRPSTDVVTGLIKANFPARIAFAVASNTDSRVILDQPGAERLLGRGDMLFQAPDAPAPVRLQGVYITDQEIARTVDYWKLEAMNFNSPQAAPNQTINLQPLPEDNALKQTPLFEDLPDKNQDPMLNESIELVRKEGKASITMLQRKLGIGYTRAARMIDLLEDKGIISPPLPHSNVREVLDFGPTPPSEEKGY